MQVTIGDIAVDVVLKDIKNVHLSVYPPTGRVRISAPERMSLDTIRVFAISNLPWIKQQQQRLRGQARETPREYRERESHYVWGTRYLLHLVEDDAAPLVELGHRQMVLRVRPATSREAKHAIVSQWYREQVKTVAADLIAKWEPILGVRVGRLFVQRMKTRWGSCNSARGNVRLNTELAKKPQACLEYVLVHEMAHLLEPTHNARFVALMERFMPEWQFHRDELNGLPIPHYDWAY